MSNAHDRQALRPSPPDSAASSTPLPARYRRTRPAWVVVTVLVFVEIISAFETSMMYAAMPTLIVEFDTDAATAGWAVTSFLLVAAASAAVCGRLGDMYGRERVLVVVLAAAAIGSLVSALGDSLGAIIAGRTIQGAAGAILPLCIGLAREHLPASRVPVAVSLVSGSAVAAGAASLLVAGALIDHASWHMIFVVTAIYAFGALALVVFVLPWRPRPDGPGGHTRERIDHLGAVTLAAAVAAILLGVNKAQSWGWTDARVAALVVGGLAALGLLVVRELRIPNPIVNLRLFAQRKFAITMIATVAISAGPLGIVTMIIPLVLQTSDPDGFGLGLSPTHAGWISFLGALVGFACTPLSGRISGATGARTAMLLGSALFAVSTVMLLVGHDSLAVMSAMIVVGSIATAFAYTALPNLVVEAVPQENTSEATGTNTVVRTVGQGVGTSVATMMLAHAATSGAGTTSGLVAVGVLVLALTVVTIALVIAIPRRTT
ncbi:MFS transporter [Rhodococcus sp. HNM0569]|uniref:MFS transporter n=1 Tax=Rhodococcus sp. HNM0569 TaxID=2716340 RepID=UPI00146AAACA|nr:MFS transporter [Rhodococcus sp. HNM0569]NLU81203.1 MFS transporter [Rhodococcus sp. HNM0569]